MKTTRRLLLFVCCLALTIGGCSGGGAGGGAKTSAAYSDQRISDSWIYLLGRLLVLRQQQLDFQEGFQWNKLVHRKPGNVQWPNPNLDVAYSEAWVAIDDSSCLIVSVPRITERYWTIQFLNGWGETVANINERVYPEHPSGQFAVCLQGSAVKVPRGAQRVDVPVKAMRVLLRIELGARPNEAVALQRRVTFRVSGRPALPEVPKTVMFDLEALPGVEAFDSAELALDSEADINPGMDSLQSVTRVIATAIRDTAERWRVDAVIRNRGFDDLKRAMPTLGDGTVRNGWALPTTVGTYGTNWLTRTLVNDGGIWANTFDEVACFKGFAGSDSTPLSGDHAYTMHFTKDELPALFATHFWSMIAVDAVHRQVLPNLQQRYFLNKESKLGYEPDGSLTLYFADAMPEGAPESNWLPTRKGERYTLTFRFYRPTDAVANHSYFPPPLLRQ